MGIGSLIGAGISGAASLFGASQSASASKAAAQAQIQAAQIAANTQMAMFGQTQNNLAPYLATGSNAAGQLTNRLGELTTGIAAPTLPGEFTQAELEATPGYQFTLKQGLKATQNSAAARGLGLSGAALKGAAGYATGLSDQTYNTRFGQRQQDFTNRQQVWQDDVTNQTNNFNRLLGTAQVGSSAAGGLGTIAANTGNNIANNLTQAGTAQAAGIMGAANANVSGLNGLASAAQGGLSMYQLQQLLQNRNSQNAMAGLFTSGGTSDWT